MAKKQTPIRFEEDELAEIRQYANSYCKGNLSMAVRQLCTKALAPATAQTAIELRVEEMINDGIERMLKIQSRGTKSALANLALSSMFFPAIAEGLRAVGEAAISGKRCDEREELQEEIDSALYTIGDFTGLSQNIVFGKAWTTGGRLQAQSGTPSLHEATKREA